MFFSAFGPTIFQNFPGDFDCRWCQKYFQIQFFFCRRSQSAEAGVGPPPNIPLPLPAVSTTASTGKIYFQKFNNCQKLSELSKIFNFFQNCQHLSPLWRAPVKHKYNYNLSFYPIKMRGKYLYLKIDLGTKSLHFSEHR